MITRGVVAQIQLHWADATDEYFATVVRKNTPQFILDNAFNRHGMIAQSGIIYGVGPDAPTSPIYRPFDGIEIALTRQAIGSPDSERLPGAALTLDQAIYGYTLGSAKLMLMEDLIGSLEPGKKADIIVLDRDIHKQVEEDVYELHETEVEMTFLGGKLIYEADDVSENLPDKRSSLFP